MSLMILADKLKLIFVYFMARDQMNSELYLETDQLSSVRYHLAFTRWLVHFIMVGQSAGRSLGRSISPLVGPSVGSSFFGMVSVQNAGSTLIMIYTRNAGKLKCPRCT